jgi:uracil-DNA glycosylase family 4
MNLLVLPQPQCTACDLHKYAKNPGVPGVFLPGSQPLSPSTPIVAVLGMNPGFQEDRSNEPFVGPSGKMLKEIYLPAILPHATVLLLNTARCYTPAAAPPKPRHFRCCFPKFSATDLDTVGQYIQPHVSKILLCTGAHAISTVTKFTHGKSWSLASAFTKQGTPTGLWGDWQLFTTFHPAAVLRSRNLLHPVADHMTLVHAAVTGSMPVASSPRVVHPFSPFEVTP